MLWKVKYAYNLSIWYYKFIYILKCTKKVDIKVKVPMAKGEENV